MKARAQWPAFVFPVIAALAVYLSTLAPGLTWAQHGADGGDLIVASVVNGVPHPTGYPTYVTLGQLWLHFPFGSIAYRFNVMSAVCMALAVGLIGYTIARAAPTRSILSPITASLWVAATPLVWGQAIIAEVYALNALFVAAILLLLSISHVKRAAITDQAKPLANNHVVAISVAAERPNRSLPTIMAAGLWGLGLGNSLTLAALAPFILINWWRTDTRGRILCGAAFLAGLCVYALIPLRAEANPPVNWGHAVTWPEFIAQVSAEMYRGYLWAVSPDAYLRRVIALVQLLVAQFGWLGVGLGAVGIGYALQRPRRDWLWYVLSILLYVLFAISYNTVDSDLYLIPVWLLAAWPIAWGCWIIADWLARHFSFISRSLALSLLFVLGPILTVITRYSDMNLRHDVAAETFAHAVFAQAPPEALLITRTDAQTFTLWYYHFLESQRPDVAIVDARLAGYPWYEPMLAAQGRTLRLPDYDPTGTWLERFRALNAGYPMCEIRTDDHSSVATTSVVCD